MTAAQQRLRVSEATISVMYCVTIFSIPPM